jgi:hypothetical protein
MSQIAERTHIGAYVEAEQRRQLVELAPRQVRSVSSVIRQPRKSTSNAAPGAASGCRQMRSVRTRDVVRVAFMVQDVPARADASVAGGASR